MSSIVGRIMFSKLAANRLILSESLETSWSFKSADGVDAGDGSSYELLSLVDFADVRDECETCTLGGSCCWKWT